MAQPNHPESNSTAPTLTFLCVKHDNNCPTILTQDGADCTCEELDFEAHSDLQRFTDSITVGRAASRKAARQVAKALRKATRK